MVETFGFHGGMNWIFNCTYKMINC